MQIDVATTIAHMADQLERMAGWLDKARAHATVKKFDADTLLPAGLAPDQLALVRQLHLHECHRERNACWRRLSQ